METGEFVANRAEIEAEVGRLYSVTTEWPQTFDAARACMADVAETYRGLLKDVRGLYGEARDALDDCLDLAKKIVPFQEELKLAEKARNKEKIKELEKKIAPLDSKAQKRSADYEGFCDQVNEGFHQRAIEAATALERV